MKLSTAEIIYPCPFSRDYGIPAVQAWRYLRVFWFYRLLIGTFFFLSFLLPQGHWSPEIFGQTTYRWVCLAYLMVTLVLTPEVMRPWVRYAHLAQLYVFSDIVALTLLTFACGGIVSGIAALMTVSLAAAGLLIGGRCAILFAALATLSILSEEVYLMEMQAFNASALKYSGFLGSSFFAITILTVVLAQRVEQTTRLANQQGRAIVRLEELNRYIIQHLQSGLLIVNDHFRVIQFNPSLLRLAGLEQAPDHLLEVSKELAVVFQDWLNGKVQNFAFIAMSSGVKLPVRFSRFEIRDETLFLMIFEDNSLYSQRLQQNKLASLGRLTASIAHEVRNPLSAIRHAAQLLSESEQLQEQDKRLTEIIDKHSNRVNRIIEDILQLSRRNDSCRQNVVLDEWLYDYVQEQNELHVEPPNPFVLELSEDAANAYIDVGHLRQIMDNLCSNALRYGHPDLGKIRLRLFLRDGSPCITIQDHGPGVAQEHVAHLFEPFFTTSNAGTGLGLYLCRELALLNRADLVYIADSVRPYFQLTLLNANQAMIEL
jgi:two-component system, NtrC family, sensor histidine kinase PilS